MLIASATRFELPQETLDQVDAIEIRLDILPSIGMEKMKKFLESSKKPVVLTLRKGTHGGGFQGSEEEREALIETLLALKPPFFDLEYDMRPAFISRMLKDFPKTKFILSYHNFQMTPENLDEIYLEMSLYPVFAYKIAAMANSTNDALKLVSFAKKDPKVSAICMGEYGSFARVIGPVIGNLINYASVDEKGKTAPGQLTVKELMENYNYKSLNADTAIYGLIGDPVANSPGHLYHNGVFLKNGLNAVYVKMALKQDELAEFIGLAKEIGIRGLSVTIPLKEMIVPFVDLPIKDIGAFNTLGFKNGKIIGTNTDGAGALDAIEKKASVRGKKVVLIGAGGAGRAIAFEAKLRGADLLILNRNEQKGRDLAKFLNCSGGSLEDMPTDYDILVNCSPDPMPIDASKIRPQTLVMDVVYFPKVTPILQEARRRKCQIVYGEEMFLNQAAAQSAFWMGL